MSKSEAILYHLANRYLRQLLPEDSLKELQCNFEEAEQLLKSNAELGNWSQRVMWLSQLGRRISEGYQYPNRCFFCHIINRNTWKSTSRN
ncbi:MAG: hypothetical protein WCL34_12330 [Methylococcaceae bacterium]